MSLDPLNTINKRLEISLKCRKIRVLPELLIDLEC